MRNHFEYGFSNMGQNVYEVKLGGLVAEPKSGYIESSECAKYIRDNNNRSAIQLCLSGGIDSEAMLQAFLKARVPFEVFFLKFENKFNNFDIDTNISICRSLNLNIKIVDLDIISFFESGDFLKYGERYRCQSPQLAAHLWLLDQLDGVPVLGGNPIIPTYNKKNIFFMGLPGDLHCAYFRYFEKNQREGVPWFFIYSPEQTSSFLRTDIARSSISSQLPPHKYSYMMKCLQYQQSGFDVRPRLNKFTGFEKVRDYYDQKMGTQFGTGFDQLFRRPLEQMNNFPEQYFQLVPKEYLVL